MNKHADFLVEIHTEELPPKALVPLAEAFKQQIVERLQKANLPFSTIQLFATPRRIALVIKELAPLQPDQTIERRGPACAAAFDAAGNATPACAGFARSCGVSVTDLVPITTPQGEWMGYTQTVTGKSVAALMPGIIEQSLIALPMAKRMRWGDSEIQFIRPIHSVIMLYGDQIIEGTILGLKAGRATRGHRFHAPAWIQISNASTYESQLETEGHVMADFNKRRQQIVASVQNILATEMQARGNVSSCEGALLDEVTGLVEWPVALAGKIDTEFLAIPKEVLVSSMQDHQRYFPVEDAENPDQLLPAFILISNIQSQNKNRVIHGNERVLRARLSDAAFFYHTDQKESLAQRLPRLKGIVYQDKLGTLYDKAERISQLGAVIANLMKVNADQVARAGWLAKADLTSHMVGEFPELQGVMGCYYAQHDGELEEVAIAIKEHYLPRFGGDQLPLHDVGQALALADRIDTLMGAFGINQLPTGDKDPFGLRRAALGVIRILIERQIDLDLKDVLQAAESFYQVKLPNQEAVSQLMHFIQERLRAWYQDQGVTPDVFASVAALQITNLLDLHQRIQAVQTFKKLPEADALCVANKRVSNILAKSLDTIAAKKIHPELFEMPAEHTLANKLAEKSDAVASLYQAHRYEEVLIQLAELRQPIDDFFDQVMVMTEDTARRENRILLLQQLRGMFTKVADIALLQ